VRCDVVYPALMAHIGSFFAGHRLHDFVWVLGPTQHVLPRFRVVRVAPGPKTGYWVYLSVGAWEVDHDGQKGFEFLIAAPEESPRHVESLAMTAYYHRDYHLDLGHTFPIGYGWVEGSACDHLLVSLPYPFGPKLEVCSLADDSQVRFLWLLPVTAAEKRFRHEHGLEELEKRFDEAEIAFASPSRQSVV
jgi:hypothetical protein